MATKNSPRSASNPVIGNVYLTPTGLKVGTRGRVQDPEMFFKQLTKGERRRIRKALHRQGRMDFVRRSLAV